MIYYFTGTGNSLWAARALGEMLDEAVENLVKYRGSSWTATGRIIGFVTPTYMMDLPWLVKEIVLKAQIPKGTYLFLVMTSSNGQSGKAFDSMDAILHRSGIRLDAAFDLQMPGNCVESSEQENARRLAAAPERIKEIGTALHLEEHNYQSPGKSAGDEVVQKSYFYGTGSLRRLTMMKHFVVGETCDGCGCCARLCPVGNIRIEAGKAVHGEACAACYACLHWCPKHATRLSVPGFKNRSQYHHPDIQMADLLD